MDPDSPAFGNPWILVQLGKILSKKDLEPDLLNAVKNTLGICLNARTSEKFEFREPKFVFHMVTWDKFLHKLRIPESGALVNHIIN